MLTHVSEKHIFTFRVQNNPGPNLACLITKSCWLVTWLILPASYFLIFFLFFFGFCLVPEDGGIVSSELSLSLNGQHGVSAQNVRLLILTAVNSSDPADIFKLLITYEQKAQPTLSFASAPQTGV
jgi:hypothetical protein